MSKRKGTTAERELIHLFWNNGWAAVRVAGSGSSQFPSADIIAGLKDKKLAIECKSVKSKYKYFEIDEISQFKEFVNKFGATGLIGMRFDRIGWYFVKLEDLEFTGKLYSANLSLAKEKGLKFEEIIKE